MWRALIIFSLFPCFLAEEQILRNELISDYDKNTFPSEDSETTTIKMGISVLNLNLDESHAILEADVWTQLKWTDPRLKWIPDEHNGIKVIHFRLG